MSENHTATPSFDTRTVAPGTGDPMFTQELSRFVTGSGFRYAYPPGAEVIADPNPEFYERVEALAGGDILRRPENGLLLHHEPAARVARDVVEIAPEIVERAELYDAAARALAAALETRLGGCAPVLAFHSPATSLIRVTLTERGHLLNWRARGGAWVAELTDEAGVPLGDHVVAFPAADADAAGLARALLDATLSHHAATPLEEPSCQGEGPVLAVFKLQHYETEPQKTYIRGRAPAFGAAQHFVSLLADPSVDQLNSYMLLPAEGEDGELGLAAGRYPVPVRLRIGSRSGREITDEDRDICRRRHDGHFAPGCACALKYVVTTADPSRPDIAVVADRCLLHRHADRTPGLIPDDAAALIAGL
jgi:hypothetical protein